MSLDAQQSKPPPPASYSAQIGRKLVRTSKYHILEYGENTSHLIPSGLPGGEIKVKGFVIAPSFVVCVFWSPLETGDSWTTIVGRRKSKSRHQLTQNWIQCFSEFLLAFSRYFWYLKNWIIIIWKIVSDISFIDQDVADVIAKYKWNSNPIIYLWKFDTCEKIDWCL